MTDLSGTQIDRYVIGNEIGRGGMARVYRAHDLTLRRDVALKILLPEITSDETGLARFLREARAAARLDHPHIVPTYDTGQADGSYFIAMPYVEGRTLREILLAEGPIQLADVRGYLDQIASALDYAHQQGIVHRDIKPENILVDASGSALLTDFGIAHAIDEMSVTTTGNVIGTPVYMAPEQLRGRPATPRSEVYALGVLVYELLAGAPPFSGRPPYAVMLAHLEEQPERIDRIHSSIPAEVGAVLSQALEKDPSDRYGSAGEFARRFALAMDGATAAAPLVAATTISVPVVPTDAPTQEAPVMLPGHGTHSWRDRWGLNLAGIGLVLGLLFLGAGAVTGGNTPAGDEASPSFLTQSETPTATATPSPPTEAAQPEVVVVEDQPEDVVEPPAQVVEQPADPEPEPPPVQEAPPRDPVEEQEEPNHNEKPDKKKEKSDNRGHGQEKNETTDDEDDDEGEDDDEDDDD